MRNHLILVILLGIVIVVSGCVGQNSITNNTTSQSASDNSSEQSQVQYKDAVNFLLNLSDLPEDGYWVLSERGERNVNDVSPDALQYNWSGGYYANFALTKDLQTSLLYHTVSIYPEDKILNIFNLSSSGEEPLSSPNIGNHSKAIKYRTTHLGQEYVFYKITFAKNNIFVTLTSGGNGIDYLVLKQIAKKAYDKIDGYGRPFILDYTAIKSESMNYTNKLYGFSMVKPKGWAMSESTGSIVQFNSPIISGESAFIVVKISDINVTRLKINKIYSGYLIDAIKSGVTNFVLIKNESLTINGANAFAVTFANTISTGENRAAKQVYIEKSGNQAFLVAYVADSSQFETYGQIFEGVLNSFQVS